MKNSSWNKNKYDVIIVLCPSERSDVDGKFVEYNKKDGSYLGGHTRMEAAVNLYKIYKLANFIVVGGLSEKCRTLEESKKTKDMKEYLIEMCGSDITCERINSLPCTKHNFIRIFTHWKEKNFNLKNKTVGILTNFFHLPRSLKFLSRALQEYPVVGNPVFIPIAAESVVSQPEIFTTKHQEYLLTLNKEVLGMHDIENEVYKDGCLLKKNEYEGGKFEDYKKIIELYKNVLLSEVDKVFLNKIGIVFKNI